MLTDYTEQQKRFSIAFTGGGTCCSTMCEACNRVYFVTSPGHGDYEDGELDALRTKAKKAPDLYIEVPDYSSVDIAYVDGKQVVIGCLCDPTAKVSEFIESNCEQITEYLRLLWQDRLEHAEKESVKANNKLVVLQETKHWKPISDAPRNATWINVRMKDGTVQRAHWASDLSGEEQPPFEGWFVRDGESFRQIAQPMAWRECTDEK